MAFNAFCLIKPLTGGIIPSDEQNFQGVAQDQLDMIEHFRTRYENLRLICLNQQKSGNKPWWLGGKRYEHYNLVSSQKRRANSMTKAVFSSVFSRSPTTQPRRSPQDETACDLEQWGPRTPKLGWQNAHQKRRKIWAIWAHWYFIHINLWAILVKHGNMESGGKLLCSSSCGLPVLVGCASDWNPSSDAAAPSSSDFLGRSSLGIFLSGI